MDIMETILSSLRLATPLIFAALGGLLAEKSGVVNIVLEGKMLVAAFVAAIAAHYTASAWWGLTAGAAAGMAMGLLYAFVVLSLRADQIVAGIALNMLAFGIPPFVSKILFDMTGNTPSLPIDSRFTYAPVLIALALMVVLHGLLYRTRFGLWIRFAGECPEALAAQGIQPQNVRWASLALSGLVAGLGGVTLSLMLASAYSRNMTAGRGYIALAALILGRWKPVPAVLACLLFGFADSLQMRLQGVMVGDVALPFQFVQMLPYVITLAVLAGVAGYAAAPAALGRREDETA